MLKKYLSLIVLFATCIIPSAIPMQSKSEIELATIIAQLFNDALLSEYNVPHTFEWIDGGIVQLSIEAYPQNLMALQYRSANPAEAANRFRYNYSELPTVKLEYENEDSDNESSKSEYDVRLLSDEQEYHIDTSAPLRMQQFASRNHMPRFPFCIKLCVQGLQDVTSLSFLSHPPLRNHPEAQLFNDCLFSLEASDCSIESLDSSLFSLFKNLNLLNLQNNKIELLIKTSIDHASSLEFLDLSDNRIKSLNGFFASGFGWLKMLSLVHNCITGLPANCLSGLLMVSYLDFTNNLLVSSLISHDAFNGVGSTAVYFNLKIVLDDNCITEFPNMHAVRGKLVALHLNGNNISYIDLDRVEELYLLKHDGLRIENEDPEAAIRIRALLAGTKFGRQQPRHQGANSRFMTP